MATLQFSPPDQGARDEAECNEADKITAREKVPRDEATHVVDQGLESAGAANQSTPAGTPPPSQWPNEGLWKDTTPTRSSGPIVPGEDNKSLDNSLEISESESPASCPTSLDEEVLHFNVHQNRGKSSEFGIARSWVPSHFTSVCPRFPFGKLPAICKGRTQFFSKRGKSRSNGWQWRS